MKIMKASRFYDVAERGYILTTKKWIVDAHLGDTLKFYFSAARREPEYDLGAYACLHFAWLRLGLTERD
jgi:hypothetical protein